MSDDITIKVLLADIFCAVLSVVILNVNYLYMVKIFFNMLLKIGQ